MAAQVGAGREYPSARIAWYMVGMRLGFGFIVACTTSVIVDWLYRKHGNTLLAPVAHGRGELVVDPTAENGPAGH